MSKSIALLFSVPSTSVLIRDPLVSLTVNKQQLYKKEQYFLSLNLDLSKLLHFSQVVGS